MIWSFFPLSNIIRYETSLKLQRQTIIEPQMLRQIHKQYYVIHNSSLECLRSQSDRLKLVTEKLWRNLQFAVADCFYKPVETLGLALSLVQARFRSSRRGRCLEPPNVQIPLIAPRGRLLWRLTHGHDSDLTAGL